MTICISAICESGDCIINVGDDQVGTGFSSTELGRTKWDDLCKNWSVGYAGTVTSAAEVLEWKQKLTEEMSSTEIFDVRSLLERSYRQARLARIEAEILASRGWTLPTFLEDGKLKLPDSIYANIDARIALFDFGAELIASGWGAENYPAILTVENPGVCYDHSRLGFWCIGSGAIAAQMSLFSRNYSMEMPIEEALYYIVEAKINAERSVGVGKRIDTFIAWKDCKDDVALAEKENDLLREIYESLRPRELSDRDRNGIDKIERVSLFKKRKKSI